MNTNGDRTTASKILWSIVAALAALVLFLAGFAANEVLAQVTQVRLEHRADLEVQNQINRDREARISRLEALVPEMKAQLNRIESKLDSHMER